MIATIVLSAIIFAALLYLIVVAALYALEYRMIFRTDRSRKNFPVAEKDSFIMTAKDGVKLEGFWRKNGSRTALVWFDGNADNVRYACNLLDSLRETTLSSIDVVGLNYRGFANSEGKPSEKALFADAAQLYDTVSPRYDRVVLLGRSLGTGIVAFISSVRTTNGVILITPYESMVRLIKRYFGFLLVHYLARNRFDSAYFWRKNHTPCAILEVVGDKVIPNSHTRSLAAQIQNLLLHEKVSDCTHASIIHDTKMSCFIDRALANFHING
ncbi:alpha/beta hydrolase [Campylobacterota bacterium]|nr:alpha/beta hydrolase [Campylobacterota bacterium]